MSDERPHGVWAGSSLLGHRALITGAGRGLGEEMARSLAAAGCGVVITDINADAAKQVAASIGGNCMSYGVDVRDPAAVRDLAREVLAAGDLSIVVNNAGINKVSPTADLALADWEDVLAVNLTGMFLVCQAFGPALAQAGRGSIVNVGSMMSVLGSPGRVAYASTKAGVVGLTMTLAVEWGHAGVRVNAILPGWIDAPMFHRVARSGAIDETHLLERIPAARFGRAREVADLVVFLCSDASTYINGQAIAVDGGYVANGSPVTVSNWAEGRGRPA